MHQLHEWLGNRPVTMKRIGDQLPEIVRREGSEHDLLHLSSGVADQPQCPRQRVRWTDLIVPKSAHQQQVPHLWMCDEMFDQTERRGVEPLQVVEKQSERMLRP